MKRIAIDLPYSELERRRALRREAEELRRPWRPPAVASFSSRFYLHALNVDYDRFRADIAYNVDCQARAMKWCLENIYDDSDQRGFAHERYSFYTSRVMLGCTLGYRDYMPWIASHPIAEAADLERLRALDVNDNPIADEERRDRAEIARLAAQYTFVYSDGREVPGRADQTPGLLSGAPFSLAVDLMGSEIYLRLKTDPPFVHEILDILVEKYIDRREYVIAEYGFPREGADFVDDSCSVLSPDTYMEFQAPYILKLYERYPGRRGIHIDGQSNHLLPIYDRVLRITRLWGFGPMVDDHLVAKHLGGKCSLLGNIDPVLLESGPPEEIRETVARAIGIYEPHGGYTIMDGNNVAPDTPLEHIALMRRTAEELFEAKG